MGLLVGRRTPWLAALPVVLAGLASPGCYDTGDGTAPPLDQFYFPVGLRVSSGGTTLYAVNSDFDLQYNGGTLQSYDLHLIRQRAVQNLTSPPPGCPDNPPVERPDAPGRQPLGETCAPPVDSKEFIRDSAIIGAFATDLLISAPAASSATDRLFVPVRGNATLTWTDVARDDAVSPPQPEDTRFTYAPFRLACGQGGDNRCGTGNQAGEDPNEAGNTRGLTLPGEPFGAALSQDGTSLVMTHQNERKSTLFSTGLSPTAPPTNPAIQFVVEEVPIGGVGVAAVPHDPDAFDLPPPYPAFLVTSRAVPQITLLRQYPDEGPSRPRPFLDVELGFPITVSAGGSDSRGIVIDPTPRIACKSKGGDRKACARKPARAFVVNRTPPMLLVGEVGQTDGVDGAYDPDRLTLEAGPSLYNGASKVYLAPIVNAQGAYELRVFIVCYDASVVLVYDPDARVVEQIIRVAPGPFAMAFDPFDLEAVANHAQAPIDPTGLRRYRFAYLASFTQSFVQIIDLDNAASPITYGRVVYTLGRPTNPKGT